MKFHQPIYCLNVRLICTQKDILVIERLPIWYSLFLERAYAMLQKFDWSSTMIACSEVTNYSRFCYISSALSILNTLRLIPARKRVFYFLKKKASLVSASRIRIWIFFTHYHSSVIDVFWNPKVQTFWYTFVAFYNYTELLRTSKKKGKKNENRAANIKITPRTCSSCFFLCKLHGKFLRDIRLKLSVA